MNRESITGFPDRLHQFDKDAAFSSDWKWPLTLMDLESKTGLPRLHHSDKWLHQFDKDSAFSSDWKRPLTLMDLESKTGLGRLHHFDKRLHHFGKDAAFSSVGC